VGNLYGKRCTAEFKRDAVALVNASPGRTVNEIARELGVSPEGLKFPPLSWTRPSYAANVCSSWSRSRVSSGVM
jgi:hypothetical protein